MRSHHGTPRDRFAHDFGPGLDQPHDRKMPLGIEPVDDRAKRARDRLGSPAPPYCHRAYDNLPHAACNGSTVIPGGSAGAKRSCFHSSIGDDRVSLFSLLKLVMLMLAKINRIFINNPFHGLSTGCAILPVAVEGLTLPSTGVSFHLLD